MQKKKRRLIRREKKQSGEKTQASSRILYLILSAGAALSACAHEHPNLRGKLWQGDSANGQIYRGQDQKALSCKDPAFDQYTALKTADLQAFAKSCKEFW